IALTITKPSGSLFCQVQETRSIIITGEVTDKETGEPLYGANVYIVNTLLGSAADETGFYRIFRVPEGKITVVASYVGYKIQKVELDITEDFNYLDFKLDLNVDVLDEIVVKAMSPRKWKSFLKKFEKEFLGMTYNAKKCKILNPEVLSFEELEDSDGFLASTEEMLIVENKALGYNLRLYLEHFSLENGMYNIFVQPTFEEMIPKNEKEKEKWEEEREKAFNGSLRHFFTSVAWGNSHTEGFIIHEADIDTDNNFRVIANDINIDSLLVDGYSDLEKAMITDTDIIITFSNETAEHLPGSNMGGFQETVLKFRDRITRFYIDGYFPESYFPVSVHGYLAYERVAELLPREYNPLYERYRKK
ncbi:carboxypeptidase-like regulatory domain-containing protein, partial [candidate division KSB1 bacterium]